jgi:hypothetical protein
MRRLGTVAITGPCRQRGIATKTLSLAVAGLTA